MTFFYCSYHSQLKNVMNGCSTAVVSGKSDSLWISACDQMETEMTILDDLDRHVCRPKTFFICFFFSFLYLYLILRWNQKTKKKLLYFVFQTCRLCNTFGHWEVYICKCNNNNLFYKFEFFGDFLFCTRLNQMSYIKLMTSDLSHNSKDMYVS